MSDDTKQAIKNISQILEISEKYVCFDSREKVYVIENCISENNFEVIKFNKDIQFDDLLDYPLKFHKCEFLESVVGYEKEFKHKLIFTNVTFKKILNLAFSIFSNEINFLDVTLEYNIDCRQCEFKEAFKAFGVMFLKRAFFENSTFEKEVHFGKEINDRNTEKSNIFGSCSFETAIFENCNFFDKVYFKNNEFKQSFFKNSTFRDNIYFNNSHFKGYADFHECEFEKTACFYGATFDNPPNFSQAIFKENLNFVNVKCDFEFENLKERIKQEYQSYNGLIIRKEPGDIPNLYQEKSLDKFANDFRDSFRLIKNALIKDNNLLDASNFHKYELYCKEIELEQIWHKQGKTAEAEADIKRNTHKFRDYIDCLLLGFYRKLCEHHTDFLKVFNNLILLIVLYALFFKGIAYLHNAKIENISEEFILSKISNNFECYFNLGFIISMVLGGILILCKINKNFFIDFIRFCFKKLNFYKRLHCNIWQSFKRFITFLKILIKDLWYLIESLILAFFFAYAFYVLLVGFGGKIIDLNKDYGYSLFINTLFVGLYISLVYTKSLVIGRYILLIASYMGFFIVLVKYPSIIHPLIGKIADTDKTCTCPSVVALSILYTILIFLVLFSLQKTARKNSIIPH